MEAHASHRMANTIPRAFINRRVQVSRPHPELRFQGTITHLDPEEAMAFVRPDIHKIHNLACRESGVPVELEYLTLIEDES